MSMLPTHQPRDEEEDAIILEDVDLADDTNLRRVAEIVETLDGRTHLRVSPLSMGQWETVINRLPAWMRKGQQNHVHILPDKREPQHLLVSPVAVQGLNQGNRLIYHEIISSLVRALPTPLPAGPLRRGVNEILIAEAGLRAGVPLGARTYPVEATFVQVMISVLVAAHGRSEIEWALLLRRKPDLFLKALRKTPFSSLWVQAALEEPSVASSLSNAGNRKKVMLSEMISSEDFNPTTPLAKLTLRAASSYLESVKRDS